MVLKCKGFLFDLDGTLVDSLPNVEHCWREFSHRIGVSETDVLHYIHGKPQLILFVILCQMLLKLKLMKFSIG
jgi:mannitol-1-/sugar-/sorbitol-6-phosphatase